jgi:hypothetical protein
MHLKALLALVCLALAGFACTDTAHYPITGVECGPDDPVKDITDQQCAPT